MQVIDQEVHKRLLENKDQICRMSGLQPKYLYESMVEYCSVKEVEWVKRFNELRSLGVPGMLLKGVSKPDTHCQAICAALTRNYIAARIIPANSLVAMHEDGIDVISPTVVLIPNLFVKSNGKSVPAFKIQVLYDILLARAAQSKPTVAYVETIEGVAAQYGQPFTDFLDGFFQVA